jgi:hypothetical protein
MVELMFTSTLADSRGMDMPELFGSPAKIGLQIIARSFG